MRAESQLDLFWEVYGIRQEYGEYGGNPPRAMFTVTGGGEESADFVFYPFHECSLCGAYAGLGVYW